MLRKILLLSIAFSLLATTALATEMIPKDETSWTCVDYSYDYHRQHPDWGFLTISYSDHLFRGMSHMVNYKLANNGTVLLIHDGMCDADYEFGGWYLSGYYFHFWQPNETPVRNYRFIRDNSDLILAEYNITRTDYDTP
jgi:hypothetical protein